MSPATREEERKSDLQRIKEKGKIYLNRYAMNVKLSFFF